jgi:hypothetical protein
MDSTAEQWAMQKWIEERLTPKPSANAISEQEMEVLLQKQIKLEQENRQLQQRVKELINVGQERIS